MASKLDVPTNEYQEKYGPSPPLLSHIYSDNELLCSGNGPEENLSHFQTNQIYLRNILPDIRDDHLIPHACALHRDRSVISE